MGRVRSGVNKVKKLFSMDMMTAQMIEDYAELLGIAQSRVVAEMLILGHSGFRRKYKMDDLRANPLEGIGDKEIKHSVENLLAKAKEQEARDPKGKRLAEAYMRDKLFGFKKRRNLLDDDGWVEDGR